MSKRAKNLATVVMLFVLSMGLAYGSLAYYAINSSAAVDGWIQWANAFPRWVVRTFGIAGHLGSGMRLIVTGVTVIVLMTLIVWRLLVALGWAAISQHFQPVIRTAIFYGISVILSQLTLITWFAWWPNTFNGFFDRADDIMGYVKLRVLVSDMYTLAFKNVVLDAKALMTVMLTFGWRIVLGLLAWVTGVNDSETNGTEDGPEKVSSAPPRPQHVPSRPRPVDPGQPRPGPGSNRLSLRDRLAEVGKKKK